MQVFTRRLIGWPLTILLLGLLPAQWWHYREAREARQRYYAQDARYTELLTMAVKDSGSVKVSDLNSAEQARDSARAEHDARDRTSDTLSLWLFAVLGAHLLFGWFNGRIDTRRDSADAA